MDLPGRIREQLAQQGFGDIRDASPVTGGSISRAWRVTAAGNRLLFLKTHDSPPPGFFEAEARGLAALAETGAIRVPEVLAVAPGFLLLEWLEGNPAADYWPRFGEQLSALHSHHSDRYGFSDDNYCGLTPQPNPRLEDGHAFFREARLLYQGRLGRERGLLDEGDLRRLEVIAGRLEECIPRQPASLIHGDLWSGNAHCGPAGEPVLLDPATHYGWPEAELAMTTLFGGFPASFYSAYEDASGCARDWRSRAPLYNLYHLLNHLNLFGGGYLGAVREILERYGRG